MPEITMLSEAHLRRLVPLDLAAIACVEEAFRTLATGGVVMPPVLRLDIAEARGEVDVKTAYVPGLSSFAIKISPGFFDNPQLGLPSVNGLMVVLNARTGLLEAALFDNGYLTDVRTAAAGAIAAKWLARPDASSAAILGAGVQAKLQLKALTLVRPIGRARLWARDADKANTAARELSDALGLPVVPAISALEAVKGADIIVTTTPAREPILLADWLEPGQHITAMGSDAEHKNEIDPAAFSRIDLYVPDRLSQTLSLGELRHAVKVKLVKPDASFSELGAVLAGRAPGRRSDREITLCDLTGTGVQDTAIANLALTRAREQGVGERFSS